MTWPTRSAGRARVSPSQRAHQTPWCFHGRHPGIGEESKAGGGGGVGDQLPDHGPPGQGFRSQIRGSFSERSVSSGIITGPFPQASMEK